MGTAGLRIRSRVGAALRAGIESIAGRDVVVVRSAPGHRRGALTRCDGDTFAAAANLALEVRRPLVMVLSTAGSDVNDGVDALVGWGRAASAVAACSGVVPLLAAAIGPAISGPALLLGLADATVMTPEAFAFVSGPEMVAAFTGVTVGLRDLGGQPMHSTCTGLCSIPADDPGHALDLVGSLLGYLPDNSDSPPPTVVNADPTTRSTPELRELVPESATASYDVRDVIGAFCDDAEMLELRAGWAPQLVTALARVGGIAVGVIANQPRSLAGTLDIPASQKGARFVRFCDAFNLPLVTLVDTPGFLPGKDLEWRGMIRHGAELAFAYAQARVPRICLVVRKAYGGAYIVMDSKGMGNDVCLAWPSAEIAVMGAQGAVQILHREAGAHAQRQLQDDYRINYLNPWVAAERGFVDQVIDPAETRTVLVRCLTNMESRREQLPGRKHDNGPM